MSEVDCCDYQDLLRKIPDNSVDVIITDPPYGIAYQNNYTHNPHSILQGDETKFSYLKLGQEAFRVLKDNTAIFVFTGWSEYPDHYKQLEACGFSMKEPLICQKRPSGKTNLYGTFQSNCDWVIFAHKGRFKFRKTNLVRNKKAGVIPNKGRQPVPEFKTRFPSCWFGEEYPCSSENSVFQKVNNIFHPTIKSVNFLKFLILLSTDENAVVVDPFVGSGSTAVACKSLKRNYIVGDVNNNFCNITRRRLDET